MRPSPTQTVIVFLETRKLLGVNAAARCRPPRRDERRRPRWPIKAPRRRGKRPSRHSSLFLPFPLAPETLAPGRRLASPFQAAPSLGEVPRSSALSRRVSYPKLASRENPNRRRHARSSRRTRALPPQNTPPAALLRPSRHHQRLPGEILVQEDLPLLFPMSPVLAGRRPVRARGCGHGLPARPTWPGPAWPMWLLRWLRAPLSATVARIAPL
jgi:hypothetical protein